MQSISDQELVDILLPQLSFADLQQLCRTDRRFHLLCQNDDLWRTKVSQDYPEWIDQKIEGWTWRKYYNFLRLSWRVPIFIDVHSTEIVWLNPYNYTKIVEKIYAEFTPEDVNKFMVTFVDTGFHPIYIFKYPNLQPTIIDNNLHQTSKIVVIHHRYIQASIPEEIKPFDIYLELTADDELHGIITQEGEFINSYDQGTFESNKDYLIGDLRVLNLYPSKYEDIMIPDVGTMVMFLQHHNLDPYHPYFPIDEETIPFCYIWLKSGVSREEMVTMIYNRLEETLHLHFLTGPLDEIDILKQ